MPEVHRAGIGTPSLLWIDVQGYEGYVFAGGADFLRTSGVPAITEFWPYGILRAGMSLDEFASKVGAIWSDYWIEARGKFIRYPISVLDRFLEEIGTEGHFENVILANGNSLHSS